MTTTAKRRVNVSRWVVTQDTSQGLTLECQAPTGSAWWLYVVAGVLIAAFLLLAGAGHDPDSPPILVALAPLFFVYWGLRMRQVRGGRIDLSEESGTPLRMTRSGTDHLVTEIPQDTIEHLLIQKRFLGWKLLIIRHVGGPIDITPPEDMNLRSLKETASLLAARLGVEVRVAL